MQRGPKICIEVTMPSFYENDTTNWLQRQENKKQSFNAHDTNYQ